MPHCEIVRRVRKVRHLFADSKLDSQDRQIPTLVDIFDARAERQVRLLMGAKAGAIEGQRRPTFFVFRIAHIEQPSKNMLNLRDSACCTHGYRYRRCANWEVVCDQGNAGIEDTYSYSTLVHSE